MNIREYLLTCLSEECAEIIQAIGKIQRFGPKDKYPKKYKGTTTDRLVEELNDFKGVIAECVMHDVIDGDWSDYSKIFAKRLKMRKYMKYSRRKRTLQ